MRGKDGGTVDTLNPFDTERNLSTTYGAKCERLLNPELARDAAGAKKTAWSCPGGRAITASPGRAARTLRSALRPDLSSRDII